VKPYYDHAGITIYHGDCREILPQLPKADLVLTDPPYGIGEHGGKARTRGINIPNHANLGWDDEPPSKEVFELILSMAPIQIIFGGNYFTDKLPVSRGWLYWRKLMGGDFADGELIWTSIDMVLKEFTKPNKGMNNQHPTQKPVELMRWCLSFAPDAKTILDPFAGSCTTGRACKDLGRKCILIEREEKYCEIGARRMGQEVFAL
jgi:site-specific DNA-methyltransferase (adenine-specific)